MTAIRIFATARDVGAARHLAALVRHAAGQASFRIVAAGAAVDTLRAAGVEAESWVAPAGRAACIDDLLRRIGAARADFVLVGMAYPGMGLDELTAIAAREAGIPSGAVQDYWGYLGAFEPGAYPDVFFVLHETAARLTERRLGAAVGCHVTGSPKHEDYRGRVARWIEAGGRRDRTRTATLFCQPRYVPGTAENLRALASAFAALPADVRLRVKLHPGDPDAAFVAAAMAPAESRLTFAGPEHTTESLLLDSDLTVTFFSTIGLDHAYLQRYSDTPIGGLLYVTVGAEISRFVAEQIGQDEIPLVDVGVGRRVRDEAGIAPALVAMLDDPDAGRRYREAVLRNLVAHPSPSAAVFDVIRRYVAERGAARPRHLLET
jgi:hypothetical protein